MYEIRNQSLAHYIASFLSLGPIRTWQTAIHQKSKKNTFNSNPTKPKPATNTHPSFTYYPSKTTELPENQLAVTGSSNLQQHEASLRAAESQHLVSKPNEADSWTNLATEGEDVEDNAGQTNGMQDLLQVTGGPITRERAKRLQGALNGLMHKLNNNKTDLWELGEKSQAKYVNVIAVQD
nr:hypothetical protein Iba_chr04cCG11960 [Ipomoea batatas]